MRVAFLLIFFTSSVFAQHKIVEAQAGEYKLSIYLPPHFDKNKAYKTLYINDGQTIFGTASINLDSTANHLIEHNLIEPLVMVGIHSDRKTRTSQYLPYLDSSAIGDFGSYYPQANRYTKKIIQQIVPFVEKEFAKSSSMGITGYSFGGIHATWAALHYPEQFVFSAGLSPSYWVKDMQIFLEAGKAKPNQTYYFDIGTAEWNYYVPMLKKFKQPLLEKIFYYEAEGGAHTLDSWRKRGGNILLLFCGQTDFSKYAWEVKQEVIKSNYTQKFYLRLNPVITYENGLKCSLSYAASFKLLNPEDGVVNADGSFRFTNPKDLRVMISYNGENREVLVSYGEIEKTKLKR